MSIKFDDIRRGIQRARDPEIVMALLAVAQAIGISAALIVAEGNQSNPIITVLSFIRGSTMGTALAFGLMGVAHSAPRIAGRKQSVLAYTALIGLLIISPIIIAPSVQANIPARILLDPLARWVWAAAIAIGPDLVAIGVAVGSKQIATESKPEQTSEQKASTEAKPEAKKQAKSKQVSKKQFACSNCEASFDTQKALNGHMSKHRKAV
jgi:hypothetical protein